MSEHVIANMVDYIQQTPSDNYKAEIIADTIDPFTKKRVTSVQVTFPRAILPQLNTHGALARSASSTRAIPTKRYIEDLTANTAEPIVWLLNEPGMQGYTVADSEKADRCKSIWYEARDKMIELAQQLADEGIHKEYVNHLLNPFVLSRVIITATEWDNFFKLRIHEAAQPGFIKLASLIKQAMDNSTPDISDIHAPYLTDAEHAEMIEAIKQCNYVYAFSFLKISAARCARVSYLNHDGNKTTIEQDLNLYKRLIESDPMHASPSEHVAISLTRLNWMKKDYFNESDCRRLRGFVPLRTIAEDPETRKIWL